MTTVVADYALPDAALIARCRIERMTSGGPGGQHANKTMSAIRIVHLSTGIEARGGDHRERARNQADALMRVRVRLAAIIRGVSDPAWLARHRRGTRLALGAHAQEFHLVAAVALDALAAAGGALIGAAESCATTPSQLAKLLTADADIRRAADALRTANGLGPLHAA